MIGRRGFLGALIGLFAVPVAKVAANDYTDDAPYMEANEKTGHEFVFRTSIPAPAWRSYNMGVPLNVVARE